MKKLNILTAGILCTLIYFHTGNMFAQNGDSLVEAKNAIIARGLDLIYSAEYDEAIRQFKKLDKIDPDSAEDMFFEAFVLELIMDVYRSQAFDDSLKNVLERALVQAESAVASNPSARNYMFLGGVYGVRGVRKGILGKLFGSARDGMKANGNLEKALDRDNSLFDSYYGVGSYHYWKTKKLRKFFGFFISDKRDQGIEEIKRSIEKGTFAKTPGQMALFRIYIEEKQYDDVIELAAKVLEKNPEHIFPRWYLGIALTRTKQWEKSKENYEVIRTKLKEKNLHGIEAEIEAWYYQGLSHFNLGETDKAKELLQQIPQYEGQVNKHLFYYDDYIKSSKKILKKIG